MSGSVILKMKKAAVYILRFCLNVIYFVLKLFPVNRSKVTFLSRQSDELSQDFKMLQERLLAEKPDTRIVSVTNRLEGENSGGMLKFGISTLKSMYHMATSKVVVLDSYWPAVSILRHKKSLTVVQIWHALGKIKQSGYQTLGKESGRSAEMARLMKMHQGYTYIIAGGKAWNPYYCASFNTTEDSLKNYGLPRIDYLLETQGENRAKVLDAYPEFADKKIVLYCPTFRRNIEIHWESIVDSLLSAGQGESASDTALIVKNHPNQKLEITDEMRKKGVYDCPDLSSAQLLAAADYLITDYSAISLEGAVLNVKTLYFVYDYEEYRSKNGMNIDLYKEMPGCVFEDADRIAEIINRDDYPVEALESYRSRFLPEELGTSTAKITELILENLL